MARRSAYRSGPAIRGPSHGMGDALGGARAWLRRGWRRAGVGVVAIPRRRRGASRCGRTNRRTAGSGRAGSRRYPAAPDAGRIPEPCVCGDPRRPGTDPPGRLRTLGPDPSPGQSDHPVGWWAAGVTRRGAAGRPTRARGGRRHGNAARRDEPGAGTATPRHGHDPVIAARRPDAHRDGSETRAGPRHAGGDTSPSTTRNTAQRNDQRDDPEHDHDTPHHETPRTRRDGRQTRARHKPPTRRDDPTRREGRQARTRPRHAPPRSSTRLAARAARPEPQFLSVVRLPPDRRRARPARTATSHRAQSGPRPLGNTDTFRLVPRRWIPVRSPSALPGAPHPKPVPGFLR